MPVPIVGLTGKMGAGKDTVYARLVELFGAANYQRASFAEPVKLVAAALFDVTVPQVEQMKNDPNFRINILHLRGAGRDELTGQEITRSKSMREMLQRIGTEMGRDLIGSDFWVELAMKRLSDEMSADNVIRTVSPTYVFTDVRFDNEAQAIIDAGGVVYKVLGPDIVAPDGQETAHASEQGVSEELLNGTINNSFRPSFEDMSVGGDVGAAAFASGIAALDDEIATLHAELRA